jgi:hypothetical protein
MIAAMDERAHAGRRKTALILAAVATAFFIAVIVRHWPW